MGFSHSRGALENMAKIGEQELGQALAFFCLTRHLPLKVFTRVHETITK